MDFGERVIGCIVGGAIGDAMGQPCEGVSRPAPAAGELSGEISDDTQLTLATCEAVADGGAVSPEDVAARMLFWFRSRRLRGLGASTLKALRDLDVGAHWALSGRRGEWAAGNGAAMRCAPLAFCLDPATSEGRRVLRDICWITHHSDEAYVGGLAIVRAIRCAVSGGWAREGSLVRHVAAGLPDTRVRDTLRSLGDLEPAAPIGAAVEISGNSGHVAASVPLAVYATQRVEERGLRDLLTELIAMGGDTDTIASLAGQIAGARVGLDALPAQLVERLPRVVLRTARVFARKLQGP